MPDGIIGERPADTTNACSRSFGVESRDVRAIDDWIEQIGREWGASDRTIFRGRLCVAELAANVVEHGAPGAGTDRMIVSLRRLDDGIEIEFSDTLAPFDPTRTATAAQIGALETVSPGGRGLALVRTYAEDIAYRHDGTYNRVMLTVRATAPDIIDRDRPRRVN
jgi:serine/threonine-protein kinase RsbW